MIKILEEPELEASQRMPLSALLATLISFASLYAVGARAPTLPIYALILIATYFTARRLPSWPWLGWVIRAIMFTIVIASAGARKFTRGSMFAGGSVLYEPDYTNLFGYLCAGELVLRAWIRRRGGPNRGEILVLSALVFMVSTNTYERKFVPIFAPLYAIFLALSLRQFTPLPKWRPKRWGTPIARAVAIGIVLMIGLTGSLVLRTYGDQITRWYVSAFIRAAPRQQIGLSTTPQLVATFNPAASPQRVLAVNGQLPDPHLRAMAFDTYTHGSWKPGFLTGGMLAEVSPEDLRPNADGRRLHVRRFPDEINLLYLPLNAAGAIVGDTPVERDTFGALHVTREESVDIEYELITSQSPDHQGPLAFPLSEKERAKALALPQELSPQVREIARIEIENFPLGKRPLAVERYLQTNCTYSLKCDPCNVNDPVSWFLLENKAGHCQYFASAAVILLRCAGVPARYVDGYYAHEIGDDNITVVRQLDAHAWAEAWIDGVGWVTVDATPSAGRPDLIFPPTPWWRSFKERFEDAWSALRTWLAKIGWTRGTIIVAGAIILFAGGQALIARLRQQRVVTARRSYSGVDADLLALARRFDRVLNSRGSVPIAEQQTWQTYLASLASVPEGSRLIEFVRNYDAARFGGNIDIVPQLRQTLSELEKGR